MTELCSFPFDAMGTQCVLHLYAPTRHDAEIAAERIMIEIDRIEVRYSRYRADSILSRINEAAETAIAKYHNVEAAGRAARTALELHGAYGLTDDFPVERFYRDTIPPLTMDGTAHIHKLLIGRSLLGISAFGY